LSIGLISWIESTTVKILIAIRDYILSSNPSSYFFLKFTKSPLQTLTFFSSHINLSRFILQSVIISFIQTLVLIFSQIHQIPTTNL